MSEGQGRSAGPAFGAEPARERTLTPWIIAAAVVLVAVAAWFLLGRGHARTAANQLLPVDPYAQNLMVTDVMMSESTSLSGGKSTFIDGHIRNSGTKTVSGVRVQVLFANDEGMPPQIETLPLMLIRTHEPYVDTEPVSVDPLKPGDEREFRLIFEALPGNWNTQVPVMRAVDVSTR